MLFKLQIVGAVLIAVILGICGINIVDDTALFFLWDIPLLILYNIIIIGLYSHD